MKKKKKKKSFKPRRFFFSGLYFVLGVAELTTFVTLKMRKFSLLISLIGRLLFETEKFTFNEAIGLFKTEE